jgi:hypothetical protein
MVLFREVNWFGAGRLSTLLDLPLPLQRHGNSHRHLVLVGKLLRRALDGLGLDVCVSGGLVRRSQVQVRLSVLANVLEGPTVGQELCRLFASFVHAVEGEGSVRHQKFPCFRFHGSHYIINIPCYSSIPFIPVPVLHSLVTPPSQLRPSNNLCNDHSITSLMKVDSICCFPSVLFFSSRS